MVFNYYNVVKELLVFEFKKEEVKLEFVLEFKLVDNKSVFINLKIYYVRLGLVRVYRVVGDID